MTQTGRVIIIEANFGPLHWLMKCLKVEETRLEARLLTFEFKI